MEKDVTNFSEGDGVRADSGTAVVDAAENYAEESTAVPDCLELVRFRRLCGHEEKDIPCARALQWAASQEDTPPCSREIEIDSPLCEHPIREPCNREASVAAVNIWNGNAPERITYRFHDEAITCPVIRVGEDKPVRQAENVLQYLQCGRKSRIQRPCGHEEDVECGNIFKAVLQRRTRKETITCSECQQESSFYCHETREEDKTQCKHLVEKKCTVCNVNTTKVQCFVENVR